MSNLLLRLEELYAQQLGIEKEIEEIEKEIAKKGNVKLEDCYLSYSKNELSWRAIKGLGNGKYENIYIGRSLRNASAKIRKWREKNAGK